MSRNDRELPHALSRAPPFPLSLLLLRRISRVRPHRRQPTRLLYPWDSPGKNTGVGCHRLLQCMKVKSESEVAQSCLTLRDPLDCSPPGSSVHGIFQARVLEWAAIAFSIEALEEFNCNLSTDDTFTNLRSHRKRDNVTT